MNSLRMTTLGGLLAVAAVGGLAAEPALAGGYVSVNVGVGSFGGYYAPAPCYPTYSVPCYVPAYVPRCSPCVPTYRTYGYSRTYYAPSGPTRYYSTTTYRPSTHHSSGHVRHVYSSRPRCEPRVHHVPKRHRVIRGLTFRRHR